MDGAAPPPGWYPDPAGQAPMRWWDGARWTEHTQQVGTPPVPQPVAPLQPRAAPAASAGALDARAFVAELKRFDGWALVVVGFVVLVLCSFLPWTGGEITGAGGSADLSANAWSGDSPWLLRGYDVTEDAVFTAAQGETVDSGTDMVLLLPLALVAVGVAVAARTGRRFERSADVGLGAAALLAVLLIVEAVHVSGALSDFGDLLAPYGAQADLGLRVGFFGGVLGGALMALGAARTFAASRQPGR